MSAGQLYAAIGAVLGLVSILGGLLAIRREIRSDGERQTLRAIDDRRWRDKIEATVADLGDTLERVGAHFEPPAPGRDDVSLPARVARVEQAVDTVTSQIDSLDRATREHMHIEQERWSGEAHQRQADSRELRTLLQDGLERVHERTDEQAKQAVAIRAELSEHIDGPAALRDRRIEAIEAVLIRTSKET